MACCASCFRGLTMELAQHSTDLDLEYEAVWPGQPFPDHAGRKGKARQLCLAFEDGTVYTWQEAVTVAQVGGSRDDLRALHALKRAIDGQILPVSRAVSAGRQQAGGVQTAGHTPQEPPRASTPHRTQKSALPRADHPPIQTNLFNC